MDFSNFREWSAERVSVSVEKVVLDLRTDETLVGRFTVYQDGRIEPEPPAQGEVTLRRQATALRAELDEQLTLPWRDIDGWKVLEHKGHVVKVQHHADFDFLAVVDGVQQTWKISPPNITRAQRAAEHLVVQMLRA